MTRNFILCFINYFTVRCVRHEKWEAASIWCIKSNDFSITFEGDTLANKVTSLYLLEGLLLFLVTKLDKRNIRAITKAEHEINNLIKFISEAAKRNKLILPRLYHLKAYYRFIKSNDVKVQKLLNKARKFAIKYGNKLEESWIEHSQKVTVLIMYIK